MTSSAAGTYPAERADAHHAALRAALREPAEPGVRNLAPLAGPKELALA